MRRSRHKLQVSTFPFLAVLLGAMGALILLLLVMDRRSKVVARNRALEAHAEMVAARTKMQNYQAQDEEAARAEWERKRQELHELLRGQEQELVQERDNLDAKLKTLNQDLSKEQQALLGLEKTILDERNRLDVKGQLLAQMRQGLAQYAQRDEKSRQEVEKLALDLAQLERALQEAKALKSQESESYSLVPYRGKLGEGRRPVYVECTSVGMVFHPDEKSLYNSEFDTQTFRTEVQRRGVDLVKEKREPGRPPTPRSSTNPYVLFLVRPDGTEMYYKAVAALRGFDLDFGYEFIDAQWVLNFSGGSGFTGQTPLPGGPPRSPNPSRVVTALPDFPTPPPLPPGYGAGGQSLASGATSGGGSPGYGSPGYGPGGGPGGPGSPTGQYGPYRAGYGPPGSGSPRGDGMPAPPSTSGGTGGAGQGGFGSGNGGGDGPRLGPIAAATPLPDFGSGQNGAGGGAGPNGYGPGNNSGGPPLPGTGVARGGSQGNAQQQYAQGGAPGSGNAVGVATGNGYGQSTGGPSLPGSAGSQSVNQGYGQQATNQGGVPGQGNSPAVATLSPRNGNGPGTNTAGPPQGPGTGQAVNQGNGQQTTNQGGVQGQGNVAGGAPGPNNGDPQSADPNQPQGADGTAWRGSQGSAAQNSGNQGSGGTLLGKAPPGSGGDPGPMNPLARMASRTPYDDIQRGPKKPAPSPSVGRMLANRDYMLTVECFKDVVALYPGGQVFSMTNGADQKKLDEAIVRSVLQLIARRQATVGAGETPYRPMLRFQIHPEAMRTYFHVYPLFENLHIPLTRENLDS